jgi:glycerophosphoryl diester phosphodiesterase
MAALVSVGVDGMFTNFPDRLNAVLGSSQALGKQGAQEAADATAACRMAP